MEGIADYVLLREIGRGVHGRVFLARPPERLGVDVDQVALKILLPGATQDRFELVADELGAYVGVGSPRLLPLYELGMDGTHLFYAMRHQPLGSLAAPTCHVSRHERLVAVGRAARAAHELHEAGVVHRAIKPGNILLDGRGALLAEPGTAHLLSRGQAMTGMGTRGDARDLELIDPQLLHGGQAGRASDIWALGVTLHVVLTGSGLHPALPSADPMVAVRMYLRSRPEPDEELAEAERSIVVRAVNADPAARYQTAQALAEDVERVAG